MASFEPPIPPKAQDLFRKAEQALAARNYAYAKVLYRSLLNDAPDCQPARMQWVKTVMAAREEKPRIAAWGYAQAALPFALALWHERKQDWPGALAAWEGCLEAMPAWPRAHKGYAQSLERMGWNEAAIEEYKVLRRLLPQDAQPLWRLAALHAAAQQRDAAREAYEAILRLHPDDPKAPGELRRLSAMDTLEKGGWKDAGGYRGKLLDEQKAQQLERDNRFLEESGAGAAPSSLQAKQEEVQRYPTNLFLRYELGELYLQQGLLDQAIGEFQKAVKNPARRAESQRHLGECFRRKGLHDLAAEQLRAAAEGLREMNALKKEILYALAGVYEEMGRQDEALREYQKIYSVDIGYKDVAKKIEGR